MLTRLSRIGLGALLTFTTLAGAQSWTRLPNAPGSGVNTSLLLTDGTVMAHTANTGTWWRLTPDINGSYINGTWSQLASMPAGYGPLYYASAVLPDGRVIVEGGEYNLGSQVWTTLGAIYNPAKNSWTPIAPPPGWSTIGDAQSVVLHDGTFMLANCCTVQAALLNASNLTWTLTGAGKVDGNDEEGWTLLPGGRVLTVDTNNPANPTNSEVFDPGTGTWSSGGSTIVQLPDINPDNSGSHEIGPAVLRPDGTVFATGGTSNTAIYNSAFGGWSVGPTFPSGLTVADGPAALLPNGNILVDAGPPGFGAGAQFPAVDCCSTRANQSPDVNVPASINIDVGIFYFVALAKPQTSTYGIIRSPKRGPAKSSRRNAIRPNYQYCLPAEEGKSKAFHASFISVVLAGWLHSFPAVPIT